MCNGGTIAMTKLALSTITYQPHILQNFSEQLLQQSKQNLRCGTTSHFLFLRWKIGSLKPGFMNHLKQLSLIRSQGTCRPWHWDDNFLPLNVDFSLLIHWPFLSFSVCFWLSAPFFFHNPSQLLFFPNYLSIAPQLSFSTSYISSVHAVTFFTLVLYFVI